MFFFSAHCPCAPQDLTVDGCRLSTFVADHWGESLQKSSCRNSKWCYEESALEEFTQEDKLNRNILLLRVFPSHAWRAMTQSRGKG